MKKTIVALSLIITVFVLPASGGTAGYTPPSAGDTCRVCGMFVAKYADWAAEIVFKDGTYAVFDGPKDLFLYLSDVQKYEPRRRETDAAALYVTDYYAVKPIDGFKAFYVGGSDVNGPMGAELIPFEKEAEAREFLKDHQGKNIYRYRDITPSVLKEFGRP